MIKDIIIFLPFLVCAFWLVTFIAHCRKNDSAQRMLTVFLATCTVLYLCHALYFTVGISEVVNGIWAMCSMSVYPLYYLYIHRLTSGSDSGKAPLWILVPGILVALIIFIYPGNISDTIRKILFFVQVVGVCWAGISKLHRFDKEINSIYVDTDGKNVSDIKALLIAFVVTSSFSAIANALGKQSVAASDALIYAAATLFSTMLYLISYLGFNRTFTYEKMVKDIPEDDHQNHEETDETLGAKIEHCMNDQMLYLQKGLKIGDLVQVVGSCRTYVSNYINHTKNMSFSDYVNSLRIERSKLLLSEEHEVKMVELAERMGFTSEQSFFRNFKKFTGMTPAQWKKENQKQS